MSIARQLSVGTNRKDFHLSPLEKQVVALALAGYTSKESAHRIGLGEHSLRQHLRNIMGKLGISNRFELVLFVLHHHLTHPIQIPPRVTEKRLSKTPRLKPGA